MLLDFLFEWIGLKKILWIKVVVILLQFIHLNVLALICRKQWRINTLDESYILDDTLSVEWNRWFTTIIISYIDFSSFSSYTCSLKNSYYFPSIRNVCFCFVLFLPPCFTFTIRKKFCFCFFLIRAFVFV